MEWLGDVVVCDRFPEERPHEILLNRFCFGLRTNQKIRL